MTITVLNPTTGRRVTRAFAEDAIAHHEALAETHRQHGSTRKSHAKLAAAWRRNLEAAVNRAK